MKTIILIFSLMFLSACNHSGGDTRLEGTWTSNKEMTLLNISKDIDLSKDKLDFLKKNLGDMQYVHKKGQVAVSFVSTPIEPLVFSKFKIHANDENSITVGHQQKEKITMHFVGNCIFHMTDWGFNEYFCKKI